MEPKMIKKQEVELDLITLETTKLPYSFKQGDANVHEITLKLNAEEGFEYERAQVHYSNGDYQDIEGLTFIIKNSALKNGTRSFEVEFVSGEEVRRSGKVIYYVDRAINSEYEAYDKYNELKKLYDVYVDAVGNEVQREQLKVELIELKNSIVSDLESINLAVDDIVDSENDRKQNEVTREEIKVELENLVIDIQDKLDNGDFVGEQGIPGEVKQSEFDDLKDQVVHHKLDYTSQRQQDNFKVATIEKDINDYQSTMASVNVNQEAKQKVNGYGIVSLPKNAANGQVSVGVKGLTATNLIENGDFSKGTEGWASYPATLEIIDGVLVSTSDGGKSNIFVGDAYGVHTNAGDKLYMRATIKVSEECILITLRNGSDIKLTLRQFPSDIFFNISTIYTANDLINKMMVYSNYPTNEISSGQKIHFKEPTMINLTQVFGTGNEPTVEECDQIFANYFDSTKSTISASRLKSVDKDGIQEITLYLPNVGELRSLPNGTKDEIRVSGGKAELVKRVSDTMEELAEPIITPINVSGNLISYPSGTVYVENVVTDAGNYTTKFDIKELQLPIKSIDKLIKYNFTTGVQTILDTTLAVINEDKKSFTHPNLTNKDMVFIDYYYDVESTLGETTIEYLDSRHTIKDSTNNKFYSWNIKSTNGVPTVELTEVL